MNGLTIAKSCVGKLDKGLDEALTKCWPVVSIKDDWKTIFPLPINNQSLVTSSKQIL
jgi:hypothetical protein